MPVSNSTIINICLDSTCPGSLSCSPERPKKSQISRQYWLAFSWLAGAIILCQGLYAQQPKFILPLISSADIEHIQFSKDGRTVVTSAQDILITGTDKHDLWDAVSGKYLQTINSGEMDESEVRWSDGGHFLLLFAYPFRQRENIEYWDVALHRIVWKKAAARGKPVCSVSGDHFIWSSETYPLSNYAVICRLATGDSIGIVNTYHSGVRNMAYGPDGKYLAINTCGACDRYAKNAMDSVRIYREGEKEQLFSVPAGKEVKALNFNDDGNLVMVATDSAVNLFKTANGEKIFSKNFPEKLEQSALGHETGILVTHFFAYPSYRSDRSGEYLQVWDTRSGKCLDSLKFPQAITAVEINRDDSEMALVMADSLFLYNLKTGKRRYAFNTGDKQNFFTAISYSPDGTKLAVGLTNGSLAFIDPVKLTVVNVAQGFKTPMVKARFTGLTNYVTWNDHGMEHEMEGAMENMAGYAFVDFAKEWSVQSGRQNLNAFRRGYSAARVTVSASGKYLLTLTKTGGAALWNARTGQKVSAFSFNPDWQYDSFIFSANEQKFAYTTIHKEHSLHIYHMEVRELKTGRLLRSIVLPDGGHIFGVTPSLDYALLEPYSQEGNWQIWDIAAKKIVYHADHQQLQGKYFEYNDDRELFFEKGRAFTAFKKGTLFIYRFVPGSDQLSLRPMQIGKDSMGLKDVQVSPTGKMIAARTDSVLYVWQTANGQLVDSLNLHVPVDQYQFYKDGSGLITGAFAGNRMLVGDWRLAAHAKNIRSFDYQMMPFERTMALISLSVSLDQRLALFAGSNGHIIAYDIAAGKILYTNMPLLVNEQFSFDPVGHFDGTPWARYNAYYGCGMKAIGFDSLKETSYEKGLISKIMGLDKKPIKAKSIGQLPICQP